MLFHLKPPTHTRPYLRPPASSEVPWGFGFQVNERYLKWDRSAQAQLVKLVVREKLDLTPEDFRSRLAHLSAVLPDLANRFETLNANLLVELVRDPNQVADKVLSLKRLVPNLNVDAAATRFPELIASYSEEDLRSEISRLVDEFNGEVFVVGELLNKEPRCIKVDLYEALKEVERLMPGCKDPLTVFLNDPGSFLTMEQLGLETSNEQPV